VLSTCPACLLALLWYGLLLASCVMDSCPALSRNTTLPRKQHLQGPVEIVLGVVAGVVGGAFCGMTHLWDTRFKRTVVCFSTGQYKGV
jgi:hypothetical protein